jgi:murein endopeptidase
MNLEITRELYKKVEEKRWEPKQSVLVVHSALEFEYSFVFVNL